MMENPYEPPQTQLPDSQEEQGESLIWLLVIWASRVGMVYLALMFAMIAILALGFLFDSMVNPRPSRPAVTPDDGDRPKQESDSYTSIQSFQVENSIPLLNERSDESS